MSNEDKHSVNQEPHLRNNGFDVDPSEKTAGEIKPMESSSETTRIDHTVWDEPTLNPAAREQIPDDAVTYERWLDRKISERSVLKSWQITVLVALSAGPWAVLGAIMSGNQSIWGIFAITVFAPAVEEIMKIAGLLWIIEKRPFLFASRFQIIVCALCGGLAFAVIENLIYLHIYIPNPPTTLVQWRWTVCTCLHCGCSVIAGLGMMRIWQTTMRERTRPQISNASTYFILAMVIHGCYNGFCIILEMAKFQF